MLVILRLCGIPVTFSSKETRLASTLSRRHKPLHIFAKQVRLQIHRVTHLPFAQRGDLKRVRNDPQLETFFRNPRDRKTDAVHRDGAFENYVAQHVSRRGDFENVILA